MTRKKAELDFAKDGYEHNLKSAGYLLAAHAAGLAGCLSTFKDYATGAQLKGGDFFIVLFGLGLLSAILNYISLSLSRSVVLNSIVGATERHEPTEDFLKRFHTSALASAMFFLFVAIAGIMWKFSDL